MSTVLLLESGLASLLAIPLGYLLGKKKGAVTLFALVLSANAIVACVAWLSYSFGIFPINHVPSAGVPLPDNYVGVLCRILEIAIWASLVMGGIGYFLEKGLGAGVFIGSIVVGTLTFFFLGLACGYFGFHDSSTLLRLAIFVLGSLILICGGLLLKAKRWATSPGLWAIFCAAFAISYAVASLWKFYLIISLPVLLFGATLYYLSQKVLPISPEQRQDAFRSLITFALGTNYAYYNINDWKTRENCDQLKPKPQVPARTFGQFFSGPGIVLSDSNHLTVISDGFKFRVLPPGLGFTYLFEQIYEVVDLRPQLRVEKIKAETKDGIVVQTNVFLPHRIATGGQEVAIGHSYPFDEGAVRLAVCSQAFVDHDWRRDYQKLAIETIKTIPWDERVLMTAPACLKDVFIHYDYNELYSFKEEETSTAPFSESQVSNPNMSSDSKEEKTTYPREVIAKEFLDSLRGKMKLMGIDLVGGGLSNIESSEAVEEQRIANWQIKWEGKIKVEQSKADVMLETKYGSTWAEAQLGVLQQLTHLLKNSNSVTAEALAFQLMTCLGTALPQTSVGQELPFEDLIKSVLHHNQQQMIEEGDRHDRPSTD
mgnify:FL=1